MDSAWMETISAIHHSILFAEHFLKLGMQDLANFTGYSSRYMASPVTSVRTLPEFGQIRTELFISAS
jgi:hypothetical protein